MSQPFKYKKITVALLLACLLTIGAPLNQALADGMDPFVGEVQCGGYNYCPMDWLSCDGQSLPIAQYNVLFSLLGTTYGGDGATTFNLPDLRGRVMMHQGQGTSLTNRALGAKGGTETHVTSQAELPSHNHLANTLAGVGDSSVPSANVLWGDSAKAPEYSTKTPSSPMAATAVLATGNGTAYNIMKPYLVNRCCIATDAVGIYPQRQ